MYVKDTEYLLAASSADYKRVRQFLSKHGVEFGRLSFPTILAIRNEDIIGALATTYSKEAIIAGPLHVDVGEGNPSFVIIRLWQAYERVLVESGIRSYHFWAWDEPGPWKKTLEQMDIQPWTTQSGRVWYKRELEWADHQV